jgi:hypothetical protein
MLRQKRSIFNCKPKNVKLYKCKTDECKTDECKSGLYVSTIGIQCLITETDATFTFYINLFYPPRWAGILHFLGTFTFFCFIFYIHLFYISLSLFQLISQIPFNRCTRNKHRLLRYNHG